MEIRARIIDGQGGDAAGCVRVADGRIAAKTFDEAAAQSSPERLVIPGVVDLSVTWGADAACGKQVIADELCAASAAGTTRICCPPNTPPILDNARAVDMVRVAAAERILPIGAATEALQGQHLSEMTMLKEAGCVAVGNALQPYADAQILLQVMKYAAYLDLPVFIHPQDASLATDGCAHDGKVATRLGFPGIPIVAETTMIGQCLTLVEEAGARAHFCRLSCARSVELIADAKHRGLPVTADVAAHQLLFTEENLLSFDTNYRVIPPYRRASDRDALREGVREGIIDIICSDSKPLATEAKLVPFPESAPGIASAQFLLPLVLNLVDEKVLSLQRAIEAVSIAPARLLSLDWAIDEGAQANLCVVERAPWRVGEVAQFSRGANHPFAETEFNWRVRQTIFGAPLYEDE